VRIGRSGAALGYCVTVGVSTLELDGPVGEVDLERMLDGGQWSLELPATAIATATRSLGAVCPQTGLV